MKLYMYCLLLLCATCRAAEIDLTSLVDWQQPILKKIEFKVDVKTTSEILGEEAKVPSNSVFFVFTATSKDLLEKRLLWIDFELTLSDGKVRKFENISFNFLGDGIECDIRKFSESFPTLPDDDAANKATTSGRLEVIKIKIVNAVFK